MSLIHTGPYVSGEITTQAKYKRAISPNLDLSTAADAVALFFTTTAITVTAVKAYMTETSTNNAQTVDVGINGTANSIVVAGSVANKAKDSVNTLTIASGAVAANKMVTAIVHQENASAGMCAICVEYTEDA